MSQAKLPKDWTMEKIGNVIELLYGKNLPKQERNESGKYPVYGSNGIVGHHNEFLVDYPSFVIGRKGSIGEVHLAKQQFWPTDVTFYTKILENKIEFDFLYYLLHYLDLPKYRLSGPKPGLNRNDIYKIEFLLPPTDIQKKIVKKLDYISEQLNEKKEKILQEINKFNSKKTIQNYKNHLLKLAFDGTLTNEKPRNSKMSDDELPKGWKCIPLGDKNFFLDIIGGGTPSRNTSEFFGGGIPWVRLKDMKSKYITKTGETLTKLGLQKSAAKLLPENAIILSTRATIGEVAISKTQLCTNQGFKSIICNENKILPEYMYYFLKSIKKILQSKSKSATYAEINKTNLETIQVLVPPIEVQKKIVQILDKKLSDLDHYEKLLKNIDDNHEVIKNQINALEKSILTMAFSGKLVN